MFAQERLGQMLLAAVFDNQGKGAAGAAVQNLALMLGLSARESPERGTLPAGSRVDALRSLVAELCTRVYPRRSRTRPDTSA